MPVPDHCSGCGKSYTGKIPLLPDIPYKCDECKTKPEKGSYIYNFEEINEKIAAIEKTIKEGKVAFHNIYHNTLNNRIKNICYALGMGLNANTSKKITELQDGTNIWIANYNQDLKNLDKQLTELKEDLYTVLQARNWNSEVIYNNKEVLRKFMKRVETEISIGEIDGLLAELEVPKTDIECNTCEGGFKWVDGDIDCDKRCKTEKKELPIEKHLNERGKKFLKGLLKVDSEGEKEYTDCTGICGFCEIKDTCNNPKRLKQTKDKFSKTQLENMREVEKKRLGENERVAGAKTSIESIKKKPIASSEIDSPNLSDFEMDHHMIHKLKTIPRCFQPLLERIKTFEIRINDRDFKVGDTLVLKEFNYEIKNDQIIGYTGREIAVEVLYILKAEGSFFSFLDDYVIMGIKF